MAHMQFDANLKEILRMDDDISKGPAPRWQKKAIERGVTSLSFNENSYLGNKSALGASPNPAKTPLSGSLLDVKKSPTRAISPGHNKSPGRMPKLSVRAPGQKTPKTPNKHGDRFIPNRSSTDLERAYQLLINSTENVSKDLTLEEEGISLKQKDYQEKMLENLNDGVAPDTRILSFQTKAPHSTDGHMNNLKVLYSTGKASVSKSSVTRHIPSVPEKVLDAPELINDYYLHPMDWSVNNHLAVALGSCVFIWNGGDGSITSLAHFEDPDHVCSLSWIKEGNVIGIGLSNNTTQLWDLAQQKLIRTMGGHTSRVTSLAWNSFILTSGSRSGQIIHHDVRVPNHVTANLNQHTQDICGLKWALDGRYLASGGNDNMINIWENGSSTPLHTFTDHQAAVKGLAWSPWQSNLLVSGGGTADRTIRLWNCSVGTCLKTVNTNSQVSSLLWSTNYRELISGHGFAQNQLTLWKYPNFCKIADLTGHTGRVLELCLSPDGETVVSAGADETLRLWKCWAVDKRDKKTSTSAKDHPISALTRTTIR